MRCFALLLSAVMSLLCVDVMRVRGTHAASARNFEGSPPLELLGPAPALTNRHRQPRRKSRAFTPPFGLGWAAKAQPGDYRLDLRAPAPGRRRIDLGSNWKIDAETALQTVATVAEVAAAVEELAVNEGESANHKEASQQDASDPGGLAIFDAVRRTWQVEATAAEEELEWQKGWLPVWKTANVEATVAEEELDANEGEAREHLEASEQDESDQEGVTKIDAASAAAEGTSAEAPSAELLGVPELFESVLNDIAGYLRGPTQDKKAMPSSLIIDLLWAFLTLTPKTMIEEVEASLPSISPIVPILDPFLAWSISKQKLTEVEASLDVTEKTKGPFVKLAVFAGDKKTFQASFPEKFFPSMPSYITAEDLVDRCDAPAEEEDDPQKENAEWLVNKFGKKFGDEQRLDFEGYKRMMRALVEAANRLSTR